MNLSGFGAAALLIGAATLASAPADAQDHHGHHGSSNHHGYHGGSHHHGSYGYGYGHRYRGGYGYGQGYGYGGGYHGYGHRYAGRLVCRVHRSYYGLRRRCYRTWG